MILSLVSIVFVADMTKGGDYNYIYDNSIGRIVESFESSTKEKTIAISSRSTLTENALEEFQRHPWRGTDNDRFSFIYGQYLRTISIIWHYRYTIRAISFYLAFVPWVMA